MFFYKNDLVRRISMHPKYIGGKHRPQSVVRKMMIQDIRENNFTPEIGYIVSLVSISEIGDGYCLPSLGLVEYPVTFEAVVLYPVIGEVIYAEVVEVAETAISFQHVCIYGVVRSHSCSHSNEYIFEENSNLPDENEEDIPGNSQERVYRSKMDSEKVIKIGTVIRVKIVQRTLGGNGFFLIASMCDESLGPVKNPPPMPTFAVCDKSDVDKDKSELISMKDLQKMWESQPYNTGTPT